ncbi:MAG: T9SS type A sorting domain-containing protein [Saprospiraceae bacterium]|nr:T9SS type A sorting domain-containing protein [Saprospiraceae bacterium]
MRYIQVIFSLLFLLIFLQIGKTQAYKVSVYADKYIELDTFESIILEDGNHLGWEKRFDLDFTFPYYDTSFNYILGDYESTYSFEEEIDFSIRLMLFGYEFDKLIDPENVTSDLRYALKLKDGKKALCLQFTKNRLTSDPSVLQFDSYINFQIWFIENGNIEVKFGDYNLDNSPVYVPNEGFYLQTVNQGPILIGPEFGLYHPFDENIKMGIDGPFDAFAVIEDSGNLTVLPPPNWAIKFEKQTTSTSEVQHFENLYFPNPARDRILFKQPLTDFSIYNIEGKQLIYSNNSNAEISEIDISGLPAGIYILKAKINNIVSINKILKK